MGVLVPYMLNTNQWNWGLKTTWFFTGIGAPFLVALWFLLPETAGYVGHFFFFFSALSKSILTNGAGVLLLSSTNFLSARLSPGDSTEP
jgi:hypothetical protein